MIVFVMIFADIFRVAYLVPLKNDVVNHAFLRSFYHVYNEIIIIIIKQNNSSTGA